MPIRPEVIEEMLKSIGLLKEEQIRKALRQQRDTRKRLGLILLSEGYISDENIRNMVVTQLGVKLEKISNIKIDKDIIRKVPVTFAHHHRVIALGFEGDTITLATDNPFNFLAFNNFKVFLGHEIQGVLTESGDIDESLQIHYVMKEGAPIDALVAGMGKQQKVTLREMKEHKPVSEKETPVVKLVSLLIAEAVKKRASDIHIEPLENRFRIRYRIDGVLHEVPGPPKRLQASVLSRIKIMSGMDIAEKRLPQDGRIRIGIGGKELDLRVSALAAI